MNSIEYEDPHNYKIIRKIGEGAFSTVYQVENINSHQLFALKVLKAKYQSTEEVSKNEEILSMLRAGSHPNVVQFRKVIFEPNKCRLSLLIELLEKNSYELLKEHKGGMPETQALYLLRQILSGLKHIHSKGLIHRDMKQENCFLNSSKMELKIGDFGSASMQVKNKELTEYVSTRWYRAPECILTCGKYDFKMDIWAAGCIFYELLTGYPLFPGRNTIDQINRINKILGTPDEDRLKNFSSPQKINEFHFLKYHKAKWSQLLPGIQNTEIYDLFEHLLAFFPSDRYTADEALSHPAFNVLKNLSLDENGCPIFEKAYKNKMFNDKKQIINPESNRDGKFPKDIIKGPSMTTKKPLRPCTPPKECRMKAQVFIKPKAKTVAFQLPSSTKIKIGENALQQKT